MSIGPSPAHDVAQHILARIPGISTSKASPPFITTGSLTPVTPGASALGIWARNLPGEQEIPFIEGGNGHGEERPDVQVFVRGDKDDPRTAEALLEAIVGVLHAQPASGIVSGYFEAKVRGSGIVSLGPNVDGFPEFVATFGLRRDAKRRPIFTGAAVPGVVDEAFLATLSSITTGRRRTSIWSATAGSGEALFFGVPTDWLGGTPVLYDGIAGRTAIPFETAGTANPSIDGEVVPYTVLRSTQLSLGAKTIKTL